MSYDYLIIGGGIVGLATARALQQRFPNSRIALLEKEAQLAHHQTGHNSGVIHAGVYYPPGSLKAKFCRLGHQQTLAFCQQNQLPYEQCGKLLVASTHQEEQRMHDLAQRCQQNRIQTEHINQQHLSQLEPNIIGLSALKVPATGIANYTKITQTLASQFIAAGGEVHLQQEVVAIQQQPQQITVNTLGKIFTGAFLLCCAGLQADRLCQLQGLRKDFQIIPYRGEYYQLGPHQQQLISHLIYPIPDPSLPFLGVHLTKMIDGSITVGPNAVQGWSREGYKKGAINIKDVASMLGFPGFWKASQKHLKTGLMETKDSIYKSGYLKRVKKYCPNLTIEDLRPYPAGIRAQAVLKDGTMVHDFLFARSARSLHVCNAPSPAATSAFPIADYLVQQVIETQEQNQ